jgi:hypothetical protein
VDLDEVAVLVDGVPVKEKLILSENAAAISIPVPSTVTVRGVKDLGDGVSYAVKFPNNRTTYFNVVTAGQSNTYTVLPRPCPPGFTNPDVSCDCSSTFTVNQDATFRVQYEGQPSRDWCVRHFFLTVFPNFL